jgi:hypothetical protein
MNELQWTKVISLVQYNAISIRLRLHQLNVLFEFKIMIVKLRWISYTKYAEAKCGRMKSNTFMAEYDILVLVR